MHRTHNSSFSQFTAEEGCLLTQDEFKHIYHMYYNYISAVCIKLCIDGGQNAEDIVHDTFMLLLERIDTFQYTSDHDVKCWLVKTARHKILQNQRAAAVKSKFIALDISDLSEEEQLEAVDQTELLDHIIENAVSEHFDETVQSVLDQLSDKERFLLLLLRREDNYQNIAAKLDTTPGAVSVRVLRLKKKVFELIQNSAAFLSAFWLFAKIFHDIRLP